MNTRILVISDLHANYQALKTLGTHVDQADIVLCAGDIIGYYCEVNEVCETVRAWNAICVRGNHDDYLLNGGPESLPDAVRFGLEFADRTIDADHRRWLASLPLMWGGELGKRTVLLVHGSPYNPLKDYLYEDRIAEAGLDRFDFDLVIFGQTHRPLIRAQCRPVLLNPGSVGQSRNQPALACAAYVEMETLSIKTLQYSYDPGSVIRLARSNGAQEWITKHLIASSFSPA